MNGIFRTLALASDLWVCAMIFFVITTLVSKPAKDIATVKTQQVRVDSLTKRIKELEKINLAKSQSGRELPRDGKQTEIFIRQSGFSLISDNNTYSASTLFDFDALLQRIRVHPAVVMYCDSRVAFNRIASVIDKLKLRYPNVTVSLAAMEE